MINKVYNEDCLIGMQRIPDKSVDMILCDLPYGTTACAWDSVVPFELLWQQYIRVIKDNGAITLTASQPFTSALVMSQPKLFRYEWIWEKSKASNFLQAGYMPLKAHENVCVFYKSKPTYNPQKTQGKPYNRGTRIGHGNPDVYNEIPNYQTHVIKSEDGLRLPRSVQYFTTAEFEGKLHPTQKPVALFEYLIKTYTNEGETVLDNCMGSGTTAIACINTKRNYIGFEKDETYYKVLTERIAKHSPQLAIAV